MKPQNINVESNSDGAYEVTVDDGNGESHHCVTVGSDDAAWLRRPGESIEELIRRSFEFLLAREPKESILSSFDLMVINRYFPSYEREIR